jgi:hypothetical protein
MTSHNKLAHEIASDFCHEWIKKAGRNPKLDAIDIMERRIASYLIVANILKRATNDKTNNVTE